MKNLYIATMIHNGEVRSWPVISSEKPSTREIESEIVGYNRDEDSLVLDGPFEV